MAVISGDGVFSHVFLGAGDVAVSEKFYDAALAPLGVKNLSPSRRSSTTRRWRRSA